MIQFILVTLTSCTVSLTIWLETVDPLVNYWGHLVEADGLEPPRLDTVPSSFQFMNEYVLPRKPVLFRFPGGFDAALNWKTHKWTNEYLMDVIGADTEMVAEEQPSNVSETVGINKKKIRAGDFFRSMDDDAPDSGIRYYSHTQDPLNEPPTADFPDGHMSQLMSSILSRLTNDFGIPSFALTMPMQKINWWFGRAKGANGSVSRLHMDDMDNVYALVKGHKRIQLFSPADTWNLYPYGSLEQVTPNGKIEFSSREYMDRFSQIDMREPVDYDKYPRFANATRYVIDMKAGELLFIPARWFHCVQSFGTHLAVNFWFAPAEELFYSTQMKRPPSQPQPAQVDVQLAALWWSLKSRLMCMFLMRCQPPR